MVVVISAVVSRSSLSSGSRSSLIAVAIMSIVIIPVFFIAVYRPVLNIKQTMCAYGTTKKLKK